MQVSGTSASGEQQAGSLGGEGVLGEEERASLALPPSSAVLKPHLETKETQS